MIAPLVINGVVLSMPEGFDITQTYEPLGGFSTLRMASGAGVRQEHWRKVKTTISANGWTPPALDTINWAQSVTIDCTAPRALRSLSNVVALPTSRRPDVAPYAWATMADGTVVEAASQIAGDTMVITPVDSAVGYGVHYWPRLVVFSDGPSQDYDIAAATSAWRLTGEEV